MRIAIKNLIYRYVFILMVFTTMITALIKIENMQPIVAVRVILGGLPLVRPLSIISFILFIALVQYINVEHILYILKNDTYLMFRYEKRKRMLYVMLKKIITTNSLFVVIIGIGVIISKCICNEKLLDNNMLEFIEILSRGYLTTLILSIIQILLLLIVGEAKTFIVITGISLLLIFISRMDIIFLSIVPVQLIDIHLLINIMFNIIIIIVGIFILEKQYIKKGLSNLC